MSDDQRAVIAAEVQKHFREEANRARAEKAKAQIAQQERGEDGTLLPGRVEFNPTRPDPAGQPDDYRRTRDVVAERAKVSQHKARQALTVAADAPELLPKVAGGERVAPWQIKCRPRPGALCAHALALRAYAPMVA